MLAVTLEQIVRRSRLGVKAHVANGVLKVRPVIAGDGVHGATADYGAHLARRKVHARTDRPRTNLVLEVQRSIRLENAPETGRQVQPPSRPTPLAVSIHAPVKGATARYGSRNRPSNVGPTSHRAKRKKQKGRQLKTDGPAIQIRCESPLPDMITWHSHPAQTISTPSGSYEVSHPIVSILPE